jgi:hypothetical protein
MQYLNKGLTALIGGLLISICAPFAYSSSIETAAPSGLADGPGVWVNMWNYPSDPESYCLKLHASGVRNIFIQTSRSNTEAISNPNQLGPLIECGHRYKMRLIAWSFAELKNPSADADKLIAAARFRSAKGERVDAVAANLENDLSQPKVEAYSAKIKEALGASYPMVAVVYSPLNHAPQVAHIPWRTLDKYYGVIAPMNYWNSKYERIEPYSYTLQTIKKIRQLVGRPDVEIHVIGDGMGTHPDSIEKFLAACRTGAATSASLYPNQKMTEEQLSCLSQYPQYFALNSRFRLAAYRELVKRGTLVLPALTDPADAITRGEFYCLLVRQIDPASLKHLAVLPDNQPEPTMFNLSALTGPDALEILSRLNVVKAQKQILDTYPAFLAETVEPKEALETVAALMQARESLKETPKQAKAAKGSRLLNNISAKAERLFVQPAYAEGRKTQSEAQPLSYLDAAQFVLQASAGLK